MKKATRNSAYVSIPTPKELQDKLPHMQFMDRTKGALPEILHESDLNTLNTALAFLFERLRLARQQFEQEDNGRFGAFTALGAFWQFVVLFDRPFAESLQVPILKLQDALAALESGTVPPLVTPIRRRRGRAPSSNAHATLRGHAAGTVKKLVDKGLSRSEAHKRVSKTLVNLGVRPERGSGAVTPHTVKNWCDEVSCDVGRHGVAAQMYDSMFAQAEEQQRYAAMSKDDAQRFALDAMAHWVQSIFPGVKKAS